MDRWQTILREVAETKARILAQLTLGSEWRSSRGFCGVVTGDHADPQKVRLTIFDAKGPYGHRTRGDLAALVDVIIDDFGSSATLDPGCVDRLLEDFLGQRPHVGAEEQHEGR